jgi:hypothetical protein
MDDLLLAVAIGVFRDDLIAIPAATIDDAPLPRHHVQDLDLSAAMRPAGKAGDEEFRRVVAGIHFHQRDAGREFMCARNMFK